jgi:LysM repeat protein
MEFENREPRNERPEEGSNTARYLLIALALGMIAVLAYGYFKNSSDDKQTTNELDSVTTPDSSINANIATAQPVVPVTQETATTTEVAVPVVEVPKATVNSASATSTPKTSTETLPVKTIDVANLEGETRMHVVGSGETFLGIANRYNLKLSTLQAMNPGVSPDGIREGGKVKVKVKAVHVVGAGDILRVVAKKYGITVEQLMAVNKKTKNVANRGEELIIPISKRQ